MNVINYKSHRFLLAALILMFWMIYLWTTAEDVYPGANHGELITASASLGITHPTGYPILTQTAHLARLLPIGDIPYRMNIVATTFTVLTIFLTAVILVKLGVDFFASLTVSAGFGLDFLFWQQATAFEVYGMHVFLSSLFVLAVISYWKTGKLSWMFFSYFMFSLTIANHLLSIFLLPFLVFIQRKHLQALFMSILFGILGLSSYLYLPLRASKPLLFTWGHPDQCFNFLRHVSGTQFQKLMLHTPLNDFFHRLELGYESLFVFPRNLLICFAVVGIIKLFKSSKRFFYGALISVLLSTFFALTYQIHDFEVYFLPSIWFLALFSGAGYHYVINQLQYWRKSIPVIILSLIVIFGITVNYPLADRSDLFIARDYGKCLLVSAPPYTYLHYQGDNPMNILSYLVCIEKQREDIHLHDLNQNISYSLPFAFASESTIHAGTYRGTAGDSTIYPHGIIYLKHQHLLQPPPADLFTIFRSNYLNREYADPSCHELVAEFCINRAEFECERGSWNQGIHYYFEALQHASNLPEVRQYVAVLLSRRGKVENAIHIENSLLKTGLAPPDSLNNLAFHLFISGKSYQKALALSEKACRLDPNNCSYLQTAARLSMSLGNLTKAESLLNRCRTVNSHLSWELEKLYQLTVTYPDHSMDVTSPDSLPELVLFSNKLYQQLQAQLMFLSTQRELNLHEMKMLYECTQKTGIYPGCIQLFEKYFGNESDVDSLREWLIVLHEKAGNTVRSEMLRTGAK